LHRAHLDLVSDGNKKVPATAKVLGEPNNEAKVVLDYWGMTSPDIIGELGADTSVVIVGTNNPDELPQNINECQIREISDHHKWVGGSCNQGYRQYQSSASRVRGNIDD